MDADKRFAQCERDGLCGGEPDQQRAGEPRAPRRSDRVHLGGQDLRFTQGSAGDWQQVAQVLARGQFRHDAAVRGVEVDLRSDEVGPDFTVPDHGHAGFVARRFDGQDGHGGGPGAGSGRASTPLFACIGAMNPPGKSKASQRRCTPKPGGHLSDCGQRASVLEFGGAPPLSIDAWRLTLELSVYGSKPEAYLATAAATFSVFLDATLSPARLRLV